MLFKIQDLENIPCSVALVYAKWCSAQIRSINWKQSINFCELAQTGRKTSAFYHNIISLQEVDHSFTYTQWQKEFCWLMNAFWQDQGYME